jgi:SAM-dependent methyltransferase
MARSLHHRLILAALRVVSPRQSFRYIYRHRLWGGESPSGSGSTEHCTRVARAALGELVRGRGLRSICDVPCGDWNYMRLVDLSGIEYFGGDIVPELVERLRQEHGGPGRRFDVVDLTSDPLPASDLVLVRDCFIHLSNADVQRALRNIRSSGSRWLLTTNWMNGGRANPDIKTGRWRRIDLRRPPFGLPEPVQTFYEQYPTEPDRALCLWSVAGIPA